MRKLDRRLVSWFLVNEQGRREFDEAADRRLGKSMRDIGQIQPVVARPSGALLAGERRLRGAKLAGLTELDVVITDEVLTPLQIVVLQISENEHRAKLTDRDKARACEELQSLDPTLDQEALSKLLNFTPTDICRYLSPTRVIPEVREAFDAGKIGFKVTYPSSQVPAAFQLELLNAALAGATREQLERRVRQIRSHDKARVGEEAPALARAAAVIGAGRTVTVSGSNLDLEGFIESLEECLQRARKARPTGVALQTFLRMLRDQHKSA